MTMKLTMNYIVHTPKGGTAPQVIDGIVLDDETDTEYGHFSGETLDQIRARYAPAELTIMALDEYTALHDAAFRSEPKPCTYEEYVVALECLPPEDWRRVAGVESFKMSEYLSGGITTIYAKKGDRCWYWKDNATASAEAIAARINAL